MTPDGMPSGPSRLITVTGWGVNVGLLTAAAHHLAPGVRIVDLTRHAWIPPGLDFGPGYTSRGDIKEIADAFDYVETLLEILHLPVRRLLWALGVALSVWAMVSASDLIVAAVSGLALLLLVGRLVFVWRRRLRSRRKSRWNDLIPRRRTDRA